MIACSRCGSLTDWDTALGPEVLCLVCYDKAVDSDGADSMAERRLRYRETHREEIKLYDRKYSMEHKAAILERQRNFRLAHKAGIAKDKRAYYEAKGFDLRDYQRRYYLEHREAILKRHRGYRKRLKASAVSASMLPVKLC